MMYICAWQAPALPPDALISSMITLAAVRPRPAPPYSSGISAAEPAGSVERRDELLRVASSRSIRRQYSSGKRAHSSRTPLRISSSVMVSVAPSLWLSSLRGHTRVLGVQSHTSGRSDGGR